MQNLFAYPASLEMMMSHCDFGERPVKRKNDMKNQSAERMARYRERRKRGVVRVISLEVFDFDLPVLKRFAGLNDAPHSPDALTGAVGEILETLREAHPDRLVRD
ncbi:MAG: hypothetical protein HQL52_19340, partial [Magnetococcales bacterium]|nr:hypothetical protein [Magnetococcales bacterium]